MARHISAGKSASRPLCNVRGSERGWDARNLTGYVGGAGFMVTDDLQSGAERVAEKGIFSS
jgi:hypothetical protein